MPIVGCPPTAYAVTMCAPSCAPSAWVESAARVGAAGVLTAGSWARSVAAGAIRAARAIAVKGEGNRINKRLPDCRSLHSGRERLYHEGPRAVDALYLAADDCPTLRPRDPARAWIASRLVAPRYRAHQDLRVADICPRDRIRQPGSQGGRRRQPPPGHRHPLLEGDVHPLDARRRRDHGEGSGTGRRDREAGGGVNSVIGSR